MNQNEHPQYDFFDPNAVRGFHENGITRENDRIQTKVEYYGIETLPPQLRKLIDVAESAATQVGTEHEQRLTSRKHRLDKQKNHADAKPYGFFDMFTVVADVSSSFTQSGITLYTRKTAVELDFMTRNMDDPGLPGKYPELGIQVGDLNRDTYANGQLPFRTSSSHRDYHEGAYLRLQVADGDEPGKEYVAVSFERPISDAPEDHIDVVSVEPNTLALSSADLAAIEAMTDKISRVASLYAGNLDVSPSSTFGKQALAERFGILRNSAS